MRVDDVLAAGGSAPPRALLDPGTWGGTVEAVVESLAGGWAIDPPFGAVLANVVMMGGRRSVLEFGAGSSSVLFAAALDAVGGGTLTSIEQDPTWCAEQWARVQEFGSVDSLLIPSTPRRQVGRIGVFVSHTDAADALSSRAPYDLVLVDAPQSFLGRGGAVPLAYTYLSEGALVILDDASRPGEQWAIAHWLRAYPGLQLDYYDTDFGNKGLAILRKRSAAAPRFSPLSFGIGLWQGYRQSRLNRPACG